MTTQTDETRRILDMVSQGKITVDEADRLLKALAAEKADTGASARGGRTPSWFRINIHKLANEHRQAKDVNIRVPVAVMKGGMRLGAIIATFAGEKAAQRMKRARPRPRPLADQRRSLEDERPRVRDVPQVAR